MKISLDTEDIEAIAAAVAARLLAAGGSASSPAPGAVQAGDWVEEVVASLPSLLSVKECAEVLRSTPRHVYRLIGQGHLRTLQHSDSNGGSSRRLIPKSLLAEYIRSREA